DHLLTHGHQLDTDPGHGRLLHLRAHVPASLPMLDGGTSVVAFSCRPLWSLRAERVDPAATSEAAGGERPARGERPAGGERPARGERPDGWRVGGGWRAPRRVASARLRGVAPG